MLRSLRALPPSSRPYTLALTLALALGACGTAKLPEQPADAGGGSPTVAPTNGTPSGTYVPGPDGGLNDADVPPPPRSGTDPFAGLFGDGGLFGGPQPSETVPPPDATEGGWKLNPDSSPECPPEPPPTPIDPCLGIYYACSWENTDGSQYTCICDWIHYLCI